MTKDWRETLFVWDGIISFIEKDDKENESGTNDPPAKDEKADASIVEGEDVKWRGTWVGCDFADATKVPTPTRGAFDEFVSSENAFEVEGHATNIDDGDDDNQDNENSGKSIGGGISTLCRVSMTEGSGYDLGEGAEKKKHKDDRHDMYFFSPTLRWMGNLRDQVQNMVLAVGENEFGSFISVGWLRVGNRVTLARRYVDAGDERAKWDIGDLRKTVFDQIANTEDGQVKLVIPPWQCSVMHADGKVSNKRQKTAKE
ncbi:hypothetical protein ACHAXR_008493 [Thalassiosira sp. AJA248-18]